jgi:CheY-like chemotaxis protein
MALHFPLFYRSGSTVFLDDDPTYLDMLGMVLPAHLQVELYMRPATFLERMREEPARWEADAAQQLQLLERWRNGQHLVPQVLRYWAANPARYQLAQTCVVDYAMPGIDGLKVLNTLLDWPGARILLTGQADDQIAIQAFNGGLIDQFIAKQAPDVGGRLLAALGKLARKPHPRLNTLWRAALQPAQQSVLQVPSVVAALQPFALRHWVEYVVLGEPFGILGLDADGRCQWLQLEPTASLHEPAELAGTAGLGPEVVRSVQAGQVLPAVELHQQLGLRGPIRTAPAFPMGDEGLLTAALFTLAPEDLPQPLYAYRHFLDAQGERRIQDA